METGCTFSLFRYRKDYSSSIHLSFLLTICLLIYKAHTLNANDVSGKGYEVTSESSEL